ncbi:MAG: hypothetical protein U0350_48730 [Caldilineaceae bacterium]
MAKSKEEVQTFALQQAAAQHGVAWPPNYGSNGMTRGMKLVMNEAQKRGLIIQSEGDLTKQTVAILSEILIEIATAYANVALNLGGINQQVQGTEYGLTVKLFNNTLLQQFGQHLLKLNGGVTQTIFGQLGPFQIQETPRTWIQRLLMADD